MLRKYLVCMVLAGIMSQLIGAGAFQVHAQEEAFYYHKGNRVTLTTRPTKQYVLFDAQTEQQGITGAIESSGARLLKFERIEPFQGLNLMQDAQPVLQWAIIEDINLENNPLIQDETSQRVLYQAPFYRTSEGKEVGLSHLFYVKLRDADDTEKLESMAEEHNVQVIGNNEYMPMWYTLGCTNKSDGNALEMANKFYESDQFAAAEPDFMADFRLRSANDHHFGDQWGLDNTGQHGGTPGTDIGACQAWGITTGNPGIIVAVLDHGIELTHPDLLNLHPDSFDTDTNSSPSVIRGSHGTACAGIIGAARNNGGLGVAGVAPDTTLMSISNSLLLGPNVSQQLANGINWAWLRGAHVISNSWGHDLLASPLIDDAIAQALTMGRGGLGTVVVFAAGNEDGPVGYPARSNPDIIAVGAMSPCAERKNRFSCDGENWWGSNYGTELDVVAPGVLVPTTDLVGSAGYDSGDYTLQFNGTSSACPHVAGVAALILGMNPSLTQRQVADIIEQNARKVGSYTYTPTSGRPNGDWHDEMGYGLVDAYGCLTNTYSMLANQQLGQGAARRAGGESEEIDEAVEFKAPEGFLESMPTGNEISARIPETPEASSAGYLWYNNVGVNLNTRLLGTSGTTKISVYAQDVDWRYSFSGSSRITHPSGHGGSGGSGWRFPSAHRFGITIYQGNRYWNVTATSSGSPTVITGLSNTQDIQITVNDTNGNYSDNSGSFDIYIRKH